MDIKHFLDKVCNEIKYKPVRTGISEELKLHIQEIKEDYQNQGMEEKKAEEKAVSQMGEAEEIGRKLNKIHKPKLDWKLLLLIIILMGFGIVVAVLKEPTMKGYCIESTIIYMILGIILSIGIYFFDYRKIKNYSNIIYLIASVIMFLPIIWGYSIGGLRYIRFFGIGIFPPTMAVPLYLIAFIGFIVDYDKMKVINIKIINKGIIINKDLVKIVICSIVSLLLLIETPSLSNTIILGIAYLIISTAKIIQKKENLIKKLIILYGIPLILTSIIMIVVIIESPYRITRIISNFDPEYDPNGSGWVGMVQKDVLENSKWIGEAETEIISSNDYMILNESNYTFIYLLGKTGIIVAGLLVCTIILISIKLIINAKSVKEQYGKYLIIGLSALYILQSFMTILMNVNMGIQTNVNLPFVTYGGVYFIVNILTIAIIFSVYRRKDINEYDKEEKKRKFIFFKIEENKEG